MHDQTRAPDGFSNDREGNRWQRGRMLGPGLMALLLAGGCYLGRHDLPPGADGGDDGAGAEGGEDSTDDGDDDPAALDCSRPRLGHTPLRRLTKHQYQQSVRDLLALDQSTIAQITEGFVGDEHAGPFASNWVSPVTQTVVGRYARAAEDLATQVVTDLDALLPCDPQIDEAACIDGFIDDLGARAFRRPLDGPERGRLRAAYDLGREQGIDHGLRLVIESLLQSPFFLYHVEFAEEDREGPDGLLALDSYSLASRLSYFLWDTMPDQALFDLADRDALRDPQTLREQARRMLDDPRARTAVVHFHEQWLRHEGLSGVEEVTKDPELFPEFDLELRAAMRKETADFVDHVVRQGDGRLHTLLTASFSIIDGPLFDLYGVERPEGHQPGDPVELPPDERVGVLTHAGILATHAYYDQTSPIHRGVLVRTNLLCETLPPPPPDVDATPPAIDPGLPTRERFEQHSEDPNCAYCHVKTDPIGFGFEHYDAIGVFRTQEASADIDATGQVLGVDGLEAGFEGARELAEGLAASEQVQQCVARQWYRYAFGRLDDTEDACALQELYDDFAASDHDVRALVLDLVVSDAFLYRAP